SVVRNQPLPGTSGVYETNPNSDDGKPFLPTPHAPPPDDIPEEQDIYSPSNPIEPSLPPPNISAFDAGIVSDQTSPTLQLIWDANPKGPLSMNSPDIQLFIDVLRSNQHSKLIKLIKWMLESDWYRKNTEEQLPPENSGLRSLIKPRGSAEACSSPFSAFLSEKMGRSSYDCLLCRNEPGKRRVTRSLVRALGHARQHFRYTKIDGYYDENTRKDQERRHQRPPKYCSVCKRKGAIQNWKRHCTTVTHKKKAAAATAAKLVSELYPRLCILTFDALRSNQENR
ncbi:16861_t:CDS:2, partial [Acaulospora colombiana]